MLIVTISVQPHCSHQEDIAVQFFFELTFFLYFPVNIFTLFFVFVFRFRFLP